MIGACIDESLAGSVMPMLGTPPGPTEMALVDEAAEVYGLSSSSDTRSMKVKDLLEMLGKGEANACK